MFVQEDARSKKLKVFLVLSKIAILPVTTATAVISPYNFA